MSFRNVLEGHMSALPVSVIKKIVAKYNKVVDIKGYSKMNKEELISAVKGKKTINKTVIAKITKDMENERKKRGDDVKAARAARKAPPKAAPKKDEKPPIDRFRVRRQIASAAAEAGKKRIEKKAPAAKKPIKFKVKAPSEAAKKAIKAQTQRAKEEARSPAEQRKREQASIAKVKAERASAQSFLGSIEKQGKKVKKAVKATKDVKPKVAPKKKKVTRVSKAEGDKTRASAALLIGQIEGNNIYERVLSTKNQGPPEKKGKSKEELWTEITGHAANYPTPKYKSTPYQERFWKAVTEELNERPHLLKDKRSGHIFSFFVDCPERYRAYFMTGNENNVKIKVDSEAFETARWTLHFMGDAKGDPMSVSETMVFSIFRDANKSAHKPYEKYPGTKLNAVYYSDSKETRGKFEERLEYGSKMFLTKYNDREWF